MGLEVHLGDTVLLAVFQLLTRNLNTFSWKTAVPWTLIMLVPCKRKCLHFSIILGWQVPVDELCQ